jgi:hypothetical protein
MGVDNKVPSRRRSSRATTSETALAGVKPSARRAGSRQPQPQPLGRKLSPSELVVLRAMIEEAEAMRRRLTPSG